MRLRPEPTFSSLFDAIESVCKKGAALPPVVRLLRMPPQALPGSRHLDLRSSGLLRCQAFTEALQHELRNTAGGRLSAHLLIRGFVFTDLTAKGRIEKPAAAWTPEQTVDFMMERLVAGDFYILCPDNDVPRALDERRILWAAGDIVENRPPLSRWHPDYAEAFAAFVKRA